jgi:DnaJ-class molecular chaperone
MAIKGRKKGIPNGNSKPKDACDFCEGTELHFGKDCGACNGTGSETMRKQLQKVYNAQNNLAINDNLSSYETET